MSLKNIGSLVLLASLYGGKALAQEPNPGAAQGGMESLEGAVKLPGGREEVAVLDDSPTWHNLLDVSDGGKGRSVSFGLKKDLVNVKSRKGGSAFSDYNYDRTNLVYCIIDRDVGVSREHCANFTAGGIVRLSPDYTDGWFSLFVEAPVRGQNELFARIDEYWRLPEPTGELRLVRRTGVAAVVPVLGQTEQTAETGTQAEAVVGVAESTRAEPVAGSAGAESASEGTATGAGSVQQGGEQGAAVGQAQAGAAARTNVAEVSESAATGAGATGAEGFAYPEDEVVAEGETVQEDSVFPIAFNFRLTYEPLSNQKYGLPNSTPRLGVDGWGIEGALGYNSRGFGAGLFAIHSRRGFEVNDLGNRVALGTGNEERYSALGIAARGVAFRDRLAEIDFRLAASLLLRREMEYGIGEAVHFRENYDHGMQSVFVDLGVAMPRLISIRNGSTGAPIWSMGLGTGLTLESLEDLRLVQVENSLTSLYGDLSRYLLRVNGIVKVENGLSVSAGWQRDSVPVLRLRNSLSPDEMRRIADSGRNGSVDLSTLRQNNLSGNQIFGEIVLNPGFLRDYPLIVDGFANVSGAVERHGLGVSGGHRRFARVGYRYETNALDFRDAPDSPGEGSGNAVDNRHMLYFELGTDLDRALMPERRILPPYTLR